MLLAGLFEIQGTCRAAVRPTVARLHSCQLEASASCFQSGLNDMRQPREAFVGRGEGERGVRRALGAERAPRVRGAGDSVWMSMGCESLLRALSSK